MQRYFILPHSSIVIVLTHQEWAVALDALDNTYTDSENGYSPESKAALCRVVQKFAAAADQILPDRKVDNPDEDD